MEKYHHSSLDSLLLWHSSSQISGMHKHDSHLQINCLRLETSRFVNTWCGRAALLRNIKFSTPSYTVASDDPEHTQTRDVLHTSEFRTYRIDPLTPLMVCNSFKLVMDSMLLDFMCVPALSDDYFQRFPCGSSCTENNDLHQLGIGTS